MESLEEEEPRVEFGSLLEDAVDEATDEVAELPAEDETVEEGGVDVEEEEEELLDDDGLRAHV